MNHTLYARRTLTLPQVKQLFTHLQGHPQEVFFTLALATGMRRGELVHLTWQDIDLTHATIQVAGKRPTIPTQGYCTAEAETPKTRYSRCVPIAPFALLALKRHRLQQEASRGAAWNEQASVFCDGEGRPLMAAFLSKDLRRLLEQAALPLLRFHDLRMSTISLLRSLDVSPAVVGALVGMAPGHLRQERLTPIQAAMLQDAVNRLHEALL